MSATVDYQVVIDRLTDAIKELNQPCAGETAVLPPERPEERRADLRADTAALLKQLHGTLDQAVAHAADAHAEHEGASAQSKVPSLKCRVWLPDFDHVQIEIPSDMKVSDLIPKIKEVKFTVKKGQKLVISENPKIFTPTRQIFLNIHSNSTFLSSYFPTLSPSSSWINLYIKRL